MALRAAQLGLGRADAARSMAAAAAPLRRLAGLAAAALLLAWLAAAAGCSRDPQLQAHQFVGEWRSSRLAAMPLHLLAGGEWEIRAADGRAAQYGIWHLEGRNMVWTVKQGGRTMRDVNAILAVDADRFELREQDGSVTRFERIR